MRNNKKDLKKIAKQIADLEKEIRLGKDVKSAEHQIEVLMCSLSLEDMLELDEYILKNNFLTN